MNFGFLGNFYLKEKEKTGESKFGNSQILCPKEIFLEHCFNGGGGLTLEGNSVVPKWPLKPKTVEKFKEKHKVIGDK